MASDISGQKGPYCAIMYSGMCQNDTSGNHSPPFGASWIVGMAVAYAIRRCTFDRRGYHVCRKLNKTCSGITSKVPAEIR